MITLTGAEIMVRLLERQGLRIIPGIPGGANLPLYDALSRSGRIRHVLARHEQGAAFMAQGMARVTGTPQACLATSGPGATNLLTALADAKLDSVPIVCITGQVPSPLIGTDAFQEVDIYGMSIPVTKHNFLARSAEELLEIIPKAFALAASGRPGPVLVDVPKDVQEQVATFRHWPSPGIMAAPVDPDAGAVARAVQALERSKRPVLCLGGGIIQSGAWGAAVRLAEKSSLPTAMTLMGLGAMPAGHPLNLGMLGMHAARSTNMLLAECDLFMAVGMRFDDRATGKVAEFCPRAEIVHIDVDASELGKIAKAGTAVAGDARLALEAMRPLARKRERSEWLARKADLDREHGLRLPGADDPRSPYGLITRAAESLGPDAAIVTDVGQHQMRTAQAYPHRTPRRWLTSGGLGTMGFGLPAAIGACLARPRSRTVLFSGDGSLLMNIQELATAVEQNANLTILLANNNCLGLVHQQQELFYGRRFFATDYSNHVDFTTLARGFGMNSFDLGASANPEADLEKALAQPGPCLVNVPMEAAENVFPMVPPGGSNMDMIGGTEDENAAA